MPATLTYPGVYIEEIPSGVHTIVGVATSIAAFVDYFKRGRLDKAVQLFNIGDFEREFGGLDAKSESSYALQQFFLNGGAQAWVVRVASNDAASADAQIDDVIPGAASALTAKAVSPGTWGNQLRVRIDADTPVSGEFNMIVAEVDAGGRRVQEETFRNLSMTTTAGNFVEKVVNDATSGSKLVRVTATGAAAPLANGTASGAHATNPTIPANPDVRVTIGDGTTDVTATPLLSLAAGAQPLTKIAPALESAIRGASPANAAFAGATVSVVGKRLVVLAGPGKSKNRVTFANGTSSAATALLLTAAATANIQEYVLGAGSIANSAQFAGVAGGDGSLPGSAALIGDLASKKGIYALEDVDLFNLLCIPRTAIVKESPTAGELTPTQAQAVISVAEQYCEKRRAFFLMDTATDIKEAQTIKDWLNANATLRHRNAGLFYPRVKIPDPLDNFRLRSIGACGTIAGLFSRIDGSRGVWKAPAGTEAALRNVAELEDILTDSENGTLNPLGINCLRNFPVFGNVCWGARTLDGADQIASDWKYVPVRRLALFLEESLYRGTQWVVFEPNDEPLWAQIRLNVGAFMHGLFRQGAFQGTTPREAYLVKCDKETTTQDDVNRGVVNILVGFAPLKPAEFVLIRIQQLAGQIQS